MIKNLLVIVLAALLGVAGVKGGSNNVSTEISAAPANDNIVKSYNFQDFTNISISGAFEVELIKSDKYSVVVEVSKAYENAVKVSKDGSTLKVGVEAKKMKIRTNYFHKVTISMPVITGINLSGASKLNSTSTFDCGMSRFLMDMSGASSANLKVNSVDAIIDLSGASNITFEGAISEADIDMSGASKGTFILNASEIDIDLSGASKATLTGSTNEMDADLSSASKLYAFALEADNVDLDASSAAVAEINVLKRFDVELSSAAKCEYLSHNAMSIKQKVSSGASLTSK